MLEHMILGIVCRCDATGYDIKKIIETKICMFYKPSFGSLYPALKRLVDKKFLTTYEIMQGARKKVGYRITEAGKENFMEWLSEPLDMEAGNDKNLVKIYFYDVLPEDIRSERIAQYESDCVKYLNHLEELEQELMTQIDIEKDYYKMSTLFYGITVTKASLKWLAAIREKRNMETLEEGRFV